MENTVIDVSEETFFAEILLFAKHIKPKENGLTFSAFAPIVNHIGRDLYKTENASDWGAEIIHGGETEFIEKRITFAVSIDFLSKAKTVNFDDGKEFVIEVQFRAADEASIKVRDDSSFLDSESENIFAAIEDQVGKDIRQNELDDHQDAVLLLSDLVKLRDDPTFLLRTLFKMGPT